MTKSPQHRFFFSVSRGTPDDQEELWANEIQEFLRQQGVNATLTKGTDHFRTEFANSSGWADWIGNVATGINCMTRQPLFTGLILGEETLGKAGAQLTSQFLTERKPVLLWKKGSFIPVCSVTELDGEDYTSGWCAETGA